MWSSGKGLRGLEEITRIYGDLEHPLQEVVGKGKAHSLGGDCWKLFKISAMVKKGVTDQE